ncbi:MAG TPA: hypothetical protein VKE69_15115 [Planctomycetota bacterium]|nr:hypothetical protein [Planctomycetota bacterium]
MPKYTIEIDTRMNVGLVQVTEDSGDLVDFQIDYSPTTGSIDFADRWLLERDYGEEFIRGMVADLEERIRKALSR